MQTADNFGAITLKDGSAKAKDQLLPFDGDEYGVFAFVDSILLLNEPQCSERLSLTQRLMINPMVRSAATELIAVQDEAIARYEAESASDMLEPVQRSAASKKAVHQRNIRGALNRVSEAPGQYILVASQPLQSCPCLDALAATRRSSSRVMIATAIRRDAACSWTGPSPVSRRLPLPSSARHSKCRSTHVRPCWWRNGSFACQPRLRRAFSAPLAPSLMLLLLSPESG